MNWRTKRLLSHLLVRMPWHETIYDLAQKHLTRRWTRNLTHTLEGDTPFVKHLKFWKSHLPDLAGANYLEFGVGRDLLGNLLAFCLGMEKQLAIDLYPYARRELINDNILQLQKIRHPDFVRFPEALVGKDLAGDLFRLYGIEYRAPCDLLSLSPSEGPFQILASTSVLEHVPESQVNALLAKCRGLCREGGLMSHEIDYSDHYAHRDSSITPYHFLQFSDSQWEKLYMPHYYTNRLRHGDYRNLLLAQGFEILAEHTTVPTNAAGMLQSVPLSERFRQHKTEDLLITQGVFFTKKLPEASGVMPGPH